MSTKHESLASLGAQVRDAIPTPSEAQRMRQRAAIERAVMAPAPDWRRPMAAVGATLVAVAALLLLWSGMATPTASKRPQETVVLRDTVTPSAAVHDATAAPPAADVVRPPAPTPDGEDVIVLEEGSVAIEPGVVRRIQAGPYFIEAKNDAACAVTWDPVKQQIDIEIRQGEIELRTASYQRTVVAGDRIRGTPSGVVVTTHNATAPEHAAAVAPGTPKWKKLAAQGRYRDAMAEVERGGFLGNLGRLGRNDLKTLADVTRLGGAGNKSSDVLSELRARFPKSREAKRAAFYLGRNAERQGRPDEAIRWYRQYLKTSEKGSLVQEVRGRLLTVLSKQGRTAEARAVSQQYLTHHPAGPYATTAQRLTTEEH